MKLAARRPFALVLTCLPCAALVPTAAVAAPTVDLADFRAPSGDEAWSARRLTGLEVRDADDERIGEVADVLVAPDERASALAVELGGVLGVGETHVRLPWDEIDSVDAIGTLRYVVLPITDADLEVPGADEVPLEPREWRTSDLIGNSVVLVDSPDSARGTVEDLRFGTDGRLEAVVASGVPGTDGRSREFPFYGYDYGFEPALDDYILPYSVADVATLRAPIEASLDAEALFEFGSAELELGAERAIGDLLAELEGAPDPERIEVVGHTDSAGPAAYNLELSQARAEAVAELVRADFPDVKVIARGVGEREPQATNDTLEGRRLNRRVDVTAFGG